jgi:anti-sigma factor RsiW
MADKDLSAELTAYIDGELDEAGAQAVEAALSRDPALKHLEARLRSAAAAVTALPAPVPSPSLRRRVLAEVERPSLRERLWGWMSGPGLFPTGVAVAAGVTAVVLWPRSSEPEGEQLLLAQNFELVEDLDLLGLEGPEDVEIVAALKELEVQR